MYKSSKSLPYVYVCTNAQTKEYYIGSRWANKVPSSDDLGKKYFTSTKKISKENINQFELEVIAEFFSSSDAWEHEQQMICECWGDPLLINGNYRKNCKVHFRNIGGYKLTEDQCKNRRKPLSAKGREVIAAANRKRLAKEEERQKLRKPKSEETKMQMRLACKLRPGPTTETKNKLSEYNKKNNIAPPSQRGKIRITDGINNKTVPPGYTIPIGWRRGATQKLQSICWSEESRAKMRKPKSEETKVRMKLAQRKRRMQLPGGLQYDGKAIKQEGTEEVQKLREEAINSGAPLAFSVG